MLRACHSQQKMASTYFAVFPLPMFEMTCGSAVNTHSVATYIVIIARVYYPSPLTMLAQVWKCYHSDRGTD